MALRPQRFCFLVCAFALLPACGGSSKEAPGLDNDHNKVADDLGTLIDVDNVPGADSIYGALWLRPEAPAEQLQIGNAVLRVVVLAPGVLPEPDDCRVALQGAVT